MGGKHDAFLNWNKYFNLSYAKQVGNSVQLLLRVQSKILNKKFKKRGGGGERTFHFKYPGAVNAVISRLTSFCVGMTVAPTIYVKP